MTAPAVLLGRSIEQERFVVHRLSLPFADNTGRRYLIGASRYDFDHIDPYADRDPFRYSQYAIAVRAVDLIRSARDQEDDGQAASSSRTWAAQASPRA